MFYDKSLFPWLPAIEDSWRDIRAELLALNAQEFLPWPERNFYNFGWTVFGLYGFGVRLDRHCDLVPKTMAAIERIPGIANAGFSRMAPHSHIRPHHNVNPEGLLRLHVPLVVPEGCEFRVREERRKWIEGDCFVFDDCLEHEAWNNSDEKRIVLLVDFPAHDLVTFRPKRKIVDSFVRRLLGKPLEYNYLLGGGRQG